MRIKPTILKLGGSVVTTKERMFTPNKKAIMRLAKEIERAKPTSLILIHGGGSFGHPIAKIYRIREGYKNSSKTLGFSKTHLAMVALNRMILEALIKMKIPAVTVQPSAFIITDNGRIQSLDTKVIQHFLELGITPVLYGDAVLDETLGFTILSGDQLVSSLAIKLNAGRIIMGVDVDGLFTADPKTSPSARLLRHVYPKELENLCRKLKEAKTSDVTGEMYGKVYELMPAVAKGIPIIILNAVKPDNIYRTLRKETVTGTTIGKGEMIV